MNRRRGEGEAVSAPDEDRIVEFFDEELEILPDAAGDESAIGWGEDLAFAGEDDRYTQERPPHWA